MKNKGEIGYIKSRRVFTLIRTLCFFALSAALFIMGYMTTHTKANLLTIVAVLGVLPSAKSAVNCIMYFRAPVPDESVYSMCKAIEGPCISNIPIMYEMYFTTYEKSYPVDALFCLHDGVFLLVGESLRNRDFSAASKGLREHIERVMNLDKIHDVLIKVYDDPEMFAERLGTAAHNEEPSEKSLKIASTLGQVVL